MIKIALKLVNTAGSGKKPALDMSAVFNALDMPILILDITGIVYNANNAAEHFFDKSLTSLISTRLSATVNGTGALESLAARALELGSSVTENSIELSIPHNESAIVDATATPIPDFEGQVVLHLIERTRSQQIERRLGYLGAARDLTDMASVLAHEIKNPLSGIRGASQLLEETASEPDQQLTSLIRDEVDRICGLVDKMGVFAEDQKINLIPVNIHKVLDRVHQIAANGFARNIKFIALYDPSLPKVPGDQDLLIQVFLNLVKNAAESIESIESISEHDDISGIFGEITLSTAYRPGVRLSLSGENAPKDLPLVVEITDNGPGIAQDMFDNLFKPFMSTKSHSNSQGSGLGLPICAKIIADHGGMIDFESQPGRSVFRVLLPIYHDQDGNGDGGKKS